MKRLAPIAPLILLVIALLIVTAILSGCSTKVDNTPLGNNLCRQDTDRAILGLTYSSDQAYINCDGSELP